VLNQLIRQEALDGYTDRWLGEVSELAALPRTLVAAAGARMLGSLLVILGLGSYTRYAVLEGVASGMRRETVSARMPGRLLQVGQELRIEIEIAGEVNETARARIVSITTRSASNGSLHCITLEMPWVCRKKPGADSRSASQSSSGVFTHRSSHVITIEAALGSHSPAEKSAGHFAIRSNGMRLGLSGHDLIFLRPAL
jgi:hypothetical protein